MSCIGFWTEGQRERLRLAALDPRPVAQFLSPRTTESKRRRVRLMALDPRPAIREAAALHTDESEVLVTLAADGDAGVRAAVARSPRCPAELLAVLVDDANDVVRGWAAWRCER